VLRVSREDFLALLREEPDFAAELLRILGLQLQGVRRTSFARDPLPSTIAILPLDAGLDGRPFAERLAAAWPHESAAILGRPDSGEEESPHAYGRLVDKCERTHEHVLLVGSDKGLGDSWTRFCLRAGDRLLGLTRIPGSPPHTPREFDLRGLDLVVLGPPKPQTLSAWVDPLEARATHLVDAPGFDATAALARGLSGVSVGLVLSGGGARGFAHIGVLDELLSAGVSIDRVAGTSMGAYIAGLFALGLSPDEIAIRCHEEFVVRNPMTDYTIPLVALTRGKKGLGMLTRSFGTARIEALARHFFCVSTDLVRSRLVVHRRGSMVWTVGASMCLPTIFPPAPTPEGFLVDGAVLNNLPVEQMAAWGEGPVIASDVSTHLPPPPLEGAPTTGSRPGRLRRQLRALVVGMEAPLPNIREILFRAITVGSIDSDAAAREYADVVITPQLDEFGLFSWKELEHLREEGRRAARAALAEVPSTLLRGGESGGLRR
jgi:predicted acylesterase/phospholipase RssA